MMGPQVKQSKPVEEKKNVVRKKKEIIYLRNNLWIMDILGYIILFWGALASNL